MASTVWKGQLTFGLVSMPIRLIRAARPERVKLRQLYRPPTAVPVERDEQPESFVPPQHLRQPEARVAPAAASAAKVLRLPDVEEERPVAPVRRVYKPASEGEETIAPVDLVKGFEYDKGQYVVLEEHELRHIAPQTSTEMQIVEFVHFNEIDPVYLETSYYIVPGENAEKPYALLFEAMRETGYAAVGQLTMHRRDHVMIVRPGKSGLLGHTMYYPDEVRSIEEFRTDTKLVVAKELDLAKALIAALAQPYDAARFKNAFRERLEQLIQSKIEGRQIAPMAPAHAPAKVIDILDALKRSLEQTKSMPKASEPATASADRKPATPERSRRKPRTGRKGG